ncbi:gluconokinase [Oleisolibacter albus]|uniref:gluconokinase n=1 Tax=Oleisolibacter albus TaxID=2171757 RepID=UPI0019621224|nr:gluconokinase [Oleisolibacter albus]
MTQDALQTKGRPGPARPAARPLTILVMGVSGCGKSSVGAALALALDLPFLEGDALHPPENIARMAAGIALTDADRRGWLDSIADRLDQARRAGAGLIVACSALKRRYRDRLRAAAPDLRLLYLAGSPDLIRARLAGRTGHFMPPGLLDSQFAALEPPTPDEHPLMADIARPVAEIVVGAASLWRPAAG